MNELPQSKITSGTRKRVLYTNAKVWQWGEGLARTGHGATYSLTDWFAVSLEEFSGSSGSGSCTSSILQAGIAPTPAEANYDSVIDLKGALVVPGLQDAHIHVGYTGESAHYVDLSGAQSIPELWQLVQAKADSHPELSWLVGVGWDQTNFGGVYPSRSDLDTIASGNRPILLYRNCWHIGVANSAALELSGLIARDSATGEWRPCSDKFAVAGGHVDVDGDGLPSGIVRETAVELVTKHMGASSHDERLAFFSAALQRCVANGLTAVQTNDGVEGLPVYQELLAAGKLPLRVQLTIQCSDLQRSRTTATGDAPLEPLDGCDTRGMLTCKRVKIFADGSLGAETAALRVPYRGKGKEAAAAAGAAAAADNRGILVHTSEALTAQVKLAKERRFRLEVHAIGDRAAEQVLDAFRAAALSEADRPILTHCQILGPDLVERMARSHVVANIQPSFVPTDGRFVRERLEDAVAASSYCWKDMMRAGVMCAGGSDAPVEHCSPLHGMHDAIYREARPEKGDQSQIAAAATRLTFAEALWLYTKGAAFADGTEAVSGAIAAGARADFTVLKAEVLEDPRRLLDADSVREVWVAGVRRYKHSSAQEPPPVVTKVDGPSAPGKNGMTRVPDSDNNGGSGVGALPQVRVRRCRCCTGDASAGELQTTTK
ncbi:amidohydrolase family-domain-containing protein [Tribonema minus]|uniref:Amidohydrolase family-domain-containing protein n=1 Tax=Tribonema minus TaxID=303371 RepID=A0A836C8Z6_9STRA|nr:amidohydrolase family-domain-containing protein [Tribonema minus]